MTPEKRLPIPLRRPSNQTGSLKTQKRLSGCLKAVAPL
jgi:hypothetical protein